MTDIDLVDTQPQRGCEMMRRLGAMSLILTLVGGLTACIDDFGPEPVPDTFVIEGKSRLSDPFADVDLESRELPKDAVLVGEGYEVLLSRYGTATELTEEAIRELNLLGETRDPPWLAGKGREFLLLHLREPEVRARPDANLPPTAVAVVVEGKARQLGGTVLRNKVIVVSVPVGADATLAVTEGGQTQSISIRTGRLVGATPKPVTPKPVTPSPSSPPDNAPVASGSIELSELIGVPNHDPGTGWETLLDVTVDIELLRHADERGPAPAGSLWAQVKVTLFCGPSLVDFKIDLSRSLTIRTAAGQVLRLPPGTSLPVPNYYEPGSSLTVPIHWSEAFQVPAKTRKLSVTYRSKATASGDRGKLTFKRQDGKNSGTITLK